MKTFYLLIVLFLSFGICKIHAQNAGNALSLDGVDDYAAPLSPNVSGFDEGTIEFWFAPLSWSTSTTVWNGGNGHPGANGDWAKIGSHSPTAGNQNLIFGVYAGAWTWSNSGVIPDPGIWRHIAATWSSSGLKVYLDGALLNTNSYSGGLPNFATELIGTSSWGSFFNGYVDEIRIWNVERSAAQINSTLLDTLSSEYYSTSDSGLIAYYRMDLLEDLGINSDSADDLRDLSVNENHLDTYGNPVLVQSGGFVITNVENSVANFPEEYFLSQNYPNPFNPSTKIRYTIPNVIASGAKQSALVILKVYDVLGNEVATLVNEENAAGNYEVDFNAAELSSGIYFYRLNAGSFIDTKKMILLK
jgi:hypothetical protein